MKRFIYSWNELNIDIKAIISEISLSRWSPNVIVGIKRGGLIPATILSHFMDLPLQIVSCQLRDAKERGLEFSELLSLDATKKILFVDDICDTGDTFKKIFQESKDIGLTNFKTCSLFFNVRQNFIVDYKAKKIDRNEKKDWIVFPWEI